MNNNKNKGKSYERSLAKHLTKVFGFNFERVPNSGAFVGGKNIFRAEKLSQNQLLSSSGDIMTPVELAHVDFECKFYKELAFNSLFTNCEVLNKWLTQASCTVKPLWFLCFKINHKGEYLAFEKKHTKLLDNLDTYMIYKNAYVVTSLDKFFEQNVLNIISNTTF